MTELSLKRGLPAATPLILISWVVNTFDTFPFFLLVILNATAALNIFVLSKEYRVLKKEGASSRNFVYTLGLAIKPKKSGKFKNHATYTISIDN